MKDKFESGDEEEEGPSGSPKQHKKPVRHHVKRRSSGRAHVTKLVPLTRANSNTLVDSEVAEDNMDSRPVIKRSQSQRSLYKSSFDRKRKPPVTHKVIKEKVMHPIRANFPVTSISVAPPIEQPFKAVAHLIIPHPIPSKNKKKKQLLYSRFISSKPQQLEYPRKEFDILNNEYRCIKKYQNPMLMSIMRCATKVSSSLSSSPLNKQRYHHLKIVAKDNYALKQEKTASLWESLLKKFSS